MQAESRTAAGPLAGIRVIDLTAMVMGPYCTQIMADMGADVIKIENPEGGDDSRHIKPPDLNGESHFYLAYNRNKKSVTVNLKSPEGLEIIKSLIPLSDVIVDMILRIRTEPGRLTNLSNRAFVGTGDDVLIASFLVQGEAPQRIYARVGGPSLEASGINGFLMNPVMELRRVSDNELIVGNDNWKDDTQQQLLIESTGIPPEFEVEPAIVATLDPDTFYSVVVRGVNDTTGFANVELYDFPEP